MLNGSGFGQAPLEIVIKILTKLSAKHCWQARQVSKVWATAARQTAKFSLAIPCNKRHVLPKLKALRRHLASAPCPKVHKWLIADELLEARALAKVLKDVECLVSITQASFVEHSSLSEAYGWVADAGHTPQGLFAV